MMGTIDLVNDGWVCEWDRVPIDTFDTSATIIILAYFSVQSL